MTRLAIQLDTDRVLALERAARGGTARAAELPWNPDRPADVVEALRARFAGVRAVRLVVGLGFLHVARVQLPPVPPFERRRMLALEPDRWFALTAPRAAVALDATGAFAFAADGARLEGWIAAFGEIAPVESVEPAPAALARVAAARGVYELPAEEGLRGLVEVAGGALRSVRRLAEGNGAPAGAARIAGVVPAETLALRGTFAVDEVPVAEMLLSVGADSAMRATRTRRLLYSAGAALVALAFFVTALGRSRDRTLAALDAAVAAAQTEAAPALAVRARIAALSSEGAVAAAVAARRSDPLAVLAVLTRALPGDAVVRSLRATGDEWEIAGTARNAAALVPRLADVPGFEDVRFLAASNRFAESGGTSESFTIAFRARRPR